MEIQENMYHVSSSYKVFNTTSWTTGDLEADIVVFYMLFFLGMSLCTFIYEMNERTLLQEWLMTKLIDKTPTTECSICLSEFQPTQQIVKLPCDHKFHLNCVSMWFERSTNCPICRREFPLVYARRTHSRFNRHILV